MLMHGPAMQEAHAASVDDVVRFFNVDLQNGLTEQQVLTAISKYGRNEMPPEEATPFWKLVLKQFDDLMVQILLVAAAISFVLAFMEKGDDRVTAFVEPMVIAAILIANATVGVIQETNAEKAIEALKAYESSKAVIIRGGQVIQVVQGDIVPGDVVELTVGDRIPADIRLAQIHSTSLRVDQSILTGETQSIRKTTEASNISNAILQDKHNIVFSGTTVSLGRARGVVIATGLGTELGKIRTQLMQEEEFTTPLKKKIDELGTLLSKVIMVICILVWIVNVGNFNDPVHGGLVRGAVYYFKIAVALAVAAIPEGLPAVVTTCLALGTRRMAKKSAIVRSLPSVETLGCTTVICSDKTGTLTTNQMSVSRVAVVDGNGTMKEYEVTGTTFAPEGEVIDMSSEVPLDFPASQHNLAEVARIAACCNDSSLQYNHLSEQYEKIGESTEVALRVLVEKIGVPDATAQGMMETLSVAEKANYASRFYENANHVVTTLEFSRDRKSMSVLCGSPRALSRTRSSAKSSGSFMLVKGAPESIMERCTHMRLNNGEKVPFNKKMRDVVGKILNRYSTQETLRCLAFATIENAPSMESIDFSNPDNFSAIEANMTFIGLCGMLDPPRPEVLAAIERCHTAGIRVIVVTGDNKGTAEAICRRIGVFDESHDLSQVSFEGRELDQMSTDQKTRAVLGAGLLSRVEPGHKYELVQMLQSQGYVVAMTGDGVNDAPALKKADIGVAMGSGTAVAKGASEMVLADDNFASIVAAVEEGRAIYNNTKQFIRYLISSNIGEVVSIFLTAITGMPEALAPVQLLWVNLVTDGMPATALGFNPADDNIMRIPPRSSDEPIVNGWLFARYLIIGLYVGVATVAGFAYWFLVLPSGPLLSWYELTHFHNCAALGVDCAIFENLSPKTLSLSILVTVEMFNALNAMSENESLLTVPPWRNKWLVLSIISSFVLHFAILYVPSLSFIFGVAPLTMEEWTIVFWFSFPVILIDEVLKIVTRRRMAGTTEHIVSKSA